MKKSYLTIAVIVYTSCLVLLNCSNFPNESSNDTLPPTQFIDLQINSINGLYHTPTDTISLSVSSDSIDLSNVIDSALVWKSDKDGILGYGSSLTISDLSENKHQIEIEYTKPYGETSSSEISLFVFNTYISEIGFSRSLHTYDTKITSDNELIVTGNGGDNQSNGMFGLKTDSFGNLKWYNFYNSSVYGRGNIICDVSDGGYIIAGADYLIDYTLPHPLPCSNLQVVKTNTDGNTVWTYNYHDSLSRTSAIALIPTNDNGYLIFSNKCISFENTEYILIVLKLNQYGNLEWEKQINELYCSEDTKIKALEDNSFLLLGHTTINDNKYQKVVKLDENLNYVWHKDYSQQDSKSCTSVTELSNGFYLITLVDSDYTFESFNSSILLIDQLGNVLEEKDLQNTALSSAIEVSDGYILTGAKKTEQQNSILFLQKLDYSNEIVWEQLYDLQIFDYYTLLSKTSNNCLIVTYNLRTDKKTLLQIVQTDPYGNLFEYLNR